MAIRVERDYAELCRFGLPADEIRNLLGRVYDLTEKGIGQVGREDLLRELEKTKQEVSGIDVNSSLFFF